MTGERSNIYHHPCTRRLADGSICNVHIRVTWSGGQATRDPHECRDPRQSSFLDTPAPVPPAPVEPAYDNTFATQGALL